MLLYCTPETNPVTIGRVSNNASRLTDKNV